MCYRITLPPHEAGPMYFILRHNTVLFQQAGAATRTAIRGLASRRQRSQIAHQRAMLVQVAQASEDLPTYGGQDVFGEALARELLHEVLQVPGCGSASALPTIYTSDTSIST